jgi:antitoxin (DNA-binding transcriptional repressor) of toxin-antitoxin stability system
MVITATEFKANLGKYLDQVQTEDILISKNGKIAAKLTNPFQDRFESARTLIGILPDTISKEEARAARLAKQ